MKTIVFVMLFFACVPPSLASADLDLDQEVLVIPDTHNAKPYIWHVRQDPQGYELVFKHMRPAIWGWVPIHRRITSISMLRNNFV